MVAKVDAAAPTAPAAKGPTIALDGVDVVFDGTEVLSGLNLRLNERRIGVIGANGSGKSTFARLLNGLQLPSRGRVTIDSLDTAKHGREVRRRVGFVFQNPDNQIVYPTVAEDLAFGLKNLGFRADEVAARIGAALERFGLAGFGERLIHNLSGGEKQRVALLGVTIMEPACIVLDEPTTGLDLRNQYRFMAAIAEMPATIIMVSHDLAALEGFDRVIWFEAGRIAGDGAPGEVIPAYVRSCR